MVNDDRLTEEHSTREVVRIGDTVRDVLTFVPGSTTDHPSQRAPGAYGWGGRMLRRLTDITSPPGRSA